MMSASKRNGIWVPQDPTHRQEPLVGKGVPVWSVVGYLRLFEWDSERVVKEFEGTLSAEDVSAAYSYYKEHTSEIDLKLKLNELFN